MSSSKVAVMSASKNSVKHVSFSTDNKSAAEGAHDAAGGASQSNAKAMTNIEQWNEIIDSKVPVIF
jgi:hypothetical protein